jgi:hypothetical protein
MCTRTFFQPLSTTCNGRVVCQLFATLPPPSSLLKREILYTYIPLMLYPLKRSLDPSDIPPNPFYQNDVSVANRLVAFYDIHGRKGGAILVCIPDTTRDYKYVHAYHSRFIHRDIPDISQRRHHFTSLDKYCRRDR